MGRTHGTGRIASMHALALRLLTLLVLTAVVGCSSRSVSSEIVGTVQAALGTAHVQSASTAAATVTLAGAVNAGDLLVAVARGATAVSDNKNGNWTAGPVNGAMQLWYFTSGSVAAAAGTMVITATGPATRLIVDEFSGGNSWSVATTANAAPAIATTATTILTTASVAAGSLVYAGGGTATNGVTWTAGTATVGVPMALGGTVNTAGSAFSEYTLVSAAGTQSPSVAGTGPAGATSCGVVVFQGAMTFSPSPSAAVVSTATPVTTVSGGSGTYSSCTMTVKNSGAAATCSLAGSTVNYTSGPTSGVADTVQVTDSQGHTGTFTVNVEIAMSFAPSPASALVSTATSVATVSGGSGTYSSCTVTVKNSGAAATCSLAGATVNYTSGPTSGVADTVQVTDNNGLSKTLTVNVEPLLSFTPSPTVAAVSMATSVATVSGGSGTYSSCTVTVKNSGGAATCSLAGTTVNYTSGPTSGVADTVQVTDSQGHTSTVTVNVEGALVFTPSPASAVVSTATPVATVSGGSGTYSSCTVTVKNSGAAATCSLAGATVNYTSGPTYGVADTIQVTDNAGLKGTLTVNVGAPGVTCGTDGSLQILYPYNKTVFPLGMAPPLVQWKDNGTATYAKVTLQYPTTGTPVFQWSEIAQENGPLSSPYNLLPTALPVTGGGRAQIPPLVWTTFQTSASASDALISVQTLEGSKITNTVSITIHFASAQLKGTIYYQSYDTNLVTHGAGNPVGAILGLQVGAAAPTVYSPTVTDGSQCRACHTASASGNLIAINDNAAGLNNLYGGELKVSPPVAGETAIAPGAGSTPNDGRFSWPAVSPDGTMIFTSEGNNPVWMSGQWGAGIATLPSGLYSVSTGASLAPAGLPTGLQGKFPTFATDTSAIAFNYASGAAGAAGAGIGDNISLARMNFTPATKTFSSLTVLYTPPAAPAGYPSNSYAAEWPSFMPAGQNGIVFQNRVAYNQNEPGGDSAYGSNNLANPNVSELQHNVGALGELWWVNTTGTKVAHRLDNANGAGYLPQGPNGHGVASTTVPSCTGVNLLTAPGCATAHPTDSAGGIPTSQQFCNAESAQAQGTMCTLDGTQDYAKLWATVGNGDDSVMNFKPTVNPVVTGGYQWVVFESRRMYGNVATINPWASNPRTTLEIQSGAAPQYPQTKKLWVAAMDANPAAGSDPSHPAFYLEGQELYSGNSRSYWVLPQCLPPGSATLCTATSDCCQTAPTSCTLDVPITADPPARHCVLNSTMTCSANGAACNVDTDCCSVATGARCSGGTCQFPPQPGYPASESISYDFQGTCAGGVVIGDASQGQAPVWQYIQTDQIIPTGTSIGITLQTAPTEAGLAAVAPSTPYSITATTTAPMYLSSPLIPSGMGFVSQPVDQYLRALSPAQASQLWLRVTVTLNASSNRMSAPTLSSLLPTFDCAATE